MNQATRLPRPAAPIATPAESSRPGVEAIEVIEAIARTRLRERHERGASPLLPQSQVPVETAGADRERAAAGAAIAPSTAPAALSVRRTPEPIRSPARSGSGLASARSAAGSVRPKPANFPTFMRGCYRTPSGARAPSATNFRPKKSNAGAGALAFTLYPTLTSRREVPSPHGRR